MRHARVSCRAFSAVAFICAMFLVGAAHAHTRSQSFSTWTVAGNTLRGVFKVDAYRATQLTEQPQDLSALLRDHLTKTLTVTQNGATCPVAEVQSMAAQRGDLRVELRFACPKDFAAAPAKLNIGAFFDVSISHVHYTRIAGPGDQLSEVVLTEGHTELTVGAPGKATASGFFDFLALGFEHVLSGIDHIAFLIALAMLAGGVRRTVAAVTGFTLGHSLTLALVALNVLKPTTPAVEALIGFTVAWAAGDALARARGLSPYFGLAGAASILFIPAIAWVAGLPSLPWLVLAGVALFAAVMSFGRQLDTPLVAPAIATVFGLAHGAGFAGPLLEMRIPGDSLLMTILAFNVGVEAGQLTALAIFGAAILAARAVLKQIPPVAFDATAAGLFALGTFWFVSRALG